MIKIGANFDEKRFQNFEFVVQKKEKIRNVNKKKKKKEIACVEEKEKRKKRRKKENEKEEKSEEISRIFGQTLKLDRCKGLQIL